MTELTLPHGSEAGKGIYIVTEDFGEKVESFRHVGLQTPDPGSSLFSDIQADLHSELVQALGPEHSVMRINMSDLSNEVIALINNIWGEEVVVVSTCPEIANPSKGFAIEINRLINMHGETLGIGPRPGNVQIEMQARMLAKRVGSQPVVLAEDGVFTGSTMVRVIRALKTAKINLVGVAVGFSFGGKADEAIEELGVRMEVAVKEYRNKTLLDWVPDHDFMPFVPGCGKVLGVEMGGKCYPYYDHDHASFSMPYIYPFGPISEWASIPEKNAKQFSAACIRLTLGLFEELERMNGKEITISDIIHSRQRVSIPISVDDGGADRVHEFPTSDTLVKSFLIESL